jgi:hypothetical protein
LVDGFDVSQASFYFQFSLKDEKWKLSLEQNLHLALTMTSILLVTPNKYPDSLQQFFSVNEWTGYLQQNTWSLQDQAQANAFGNNHRYARCYRKPHCDFVVIV